MRILNTGASGFIGRYLSEYARDQGQEIIGTYLSKEELSVSDLRKQGIEWVHLDMQDFGEIRSTVEQSRPDAVFHLAAQAYAKNAWNDPLDTFRTNVMGTIAL